MTAETLQTSSLPNFFDVDRYRSGVSSERHQDAIASRPSERVVRDCHFRISRALIGLAYQCVTSHSLLGMRNSGGPAKENFVAQSCANSPMLVSTPVPMLNDSPK